MSWPEKHGTVANDNQPPTHPFADSCLPAPRPLGETDGHQRRYAATTGPVLIRWYGTRQPDISNVPAPDIDPYEARLELARRYLQVFGPATPEAFARLAGIRPAGGITAFE